MTPKAAKISQQPNVAIIVPFQDLHEAQKRSAHMKMFVPHMEKYLKDTGLNNYHVYIVEQSEDGKKFNRGKLLNIGYDIAKQDYNVYIFHDVDLLPGEDLGLYYSTMPKEPVHIARVWDRYNNNSKYFGGIVAFGKEDFVKINGYPNNFWGWGGEDDELYKRVKKSNLHISFPKSYDVKRIVFIKTISGTITDLEEMDLKQKLTLLKQTDWKCMVKWELLDEHDKTWQQNGLSSLKYKVVKNTPFSDHCTKVTVELGLNDHWSDTKTTWK